MKRLNFFAISLFGLLALLFNCDSDNNSDDVTEEVIYNIGDIGPAGGIIFYDRGANRSSNDWQYIEVALADLPGSEWGCFNTPVINARDLEIGAGLQNTINIVEFHNALNDFYNTPENCSDESNGTVAAKYCYDLVLNGFDDWHLPSEGEATLLYENLHLIGLGDFEANYDNPILYWTSSEHDDNTASAMDFATGNQGWLCKQCDYGQLTRIRPVRYF